ncbi:hypothetical protein [Paenibacillus sp. TH7-28]
MSNQSLNHLTHPNPPRRQEENKACLTAQPNNQRLTVKPVTDRGKKNRKGVESLRTRKAGGLVGRSISAARTLCTIISFDPEAERKINSGKENRFGRRRFRRSEADLTEEWGKTSEKMKGP